jgi:hypothetical protein
MEAVQWFWENGVARGRAAQVMTLLECPAGNRNPPALITDEPQHRVFPRAVRFSRHHDHAAGVCNKVLPVHRGLFSTVLYLSREAKDPLLTERDRCDWRARHKLSSVVVMWPDIVAERTVVPVQEQSVEGAVDS